MRIAILDTEPAHAERLDTVLTTAGHSCHLFRDEKALTIKLKRETFDAALIGITPEISADVRAIQRLVDALGKHVAVVFMAQASGAAEFTQTVSRTSATTLVKPVNSSELLKALGGFLQTGRADEATPNEEVFGEYVFDVVTRRVTMSGVNVTLTHKEFDLARLLFRNVNRPMSREAIQDAIWNHACFIPSRTLDTHVSALRNKLCLRPDRGYRLLPIYRFGYQLEHIGVAAREGKSFDPHAGIERASLDLNSFGYEAPRS